MIKFPITTVALVLAMATSVNAQSYKVLHVFTGSDPSCPGFSGTISQSPGGYLYSTAPDCTTGGLGSAFRMNVTGAVDVIHQFGTNIWPVSGLILATDQRFHGTTQEGGLYNRGTIFRITPDGILTTEHNFTGGADGGLPNSPPIQSVSGHFYGTAGSGGSAGFGVVYRITIQGDFTVLHTFAGPEGQFPTAALIQGSDFGFYGVTESGGKYGVGTIFRISSEGYYKVLYNFDGTHGAVPMGQLIQASDGNFYGATSQGGSSKHGVIFRLTPSLTFTVLHNFSGGFDGDQEVAGLVQASDGNFYGTNERGGANGYGVLYRITPAGAFTVLHDFEPSTGTDPQATLIQHTNGKLYGDTSSGGDIFGGSSGGGVFYSVDLGLPPFVTFLTVYGRVGAHVVILGQGFTNSSIVSFNGVPAENPEIHPTFIKAIVPDGATTGDITVTTTSRTLKSNKIFVIH